MSITVQWLGHASFRISHNDIVIYIDPWKLDASPHDATVVLVSHSHHDHYSSADIAKVSGPDAKIITSADVVKQVGKGQLITPGETIEAGGVSITGVAAYNPNKQFHPKANKWLGFIVQVDSKQIYYAGDTDMTTEMQKLTNIELALLPVGGTYTMDAAEAAQAVKYIKPRRAVPYHWGDIVGSRSDAERFAAEAECEVTVLTAGESMSL